ncbi:hypothetical protein BASA81_012438 [Batrachochytrium salamandrivorans]|nr:hypothetical protein BASA81_012438 [Batrachochytrium salamandrivorans]
MFLVRIFREGKAKEGGTPRRRKTLPSSVPSTLEENHDEPVLKICGFSSSLAVSTPAPLEDENRVIKLVRLETLLSVCENGNWNGEMETVQVGVDLFLSKVCRNTTAVSWEGLVPSPDLLERVKQQQVEFVWLDPVCELKDTRMVFGNCFSVVADCHLPNGSFSQQYFQSSKTLVHRLIRSEHLNALRGGDFFPQQVSQAMSHLQAMEVDWDVQSQWGVRTAKSMTDLQLSSSTAGDSPEETALRLVCEQVLERYPVLSLGGLEHVPLDGQVGQVMKLVVRLSALYEWFTNPDPADAMWNTIQVPPKELKLTLMALMVQKIGTAAEPFARNDEAFQDILWEMEQSIWGKNSGRGTGDHTSEYDEGETVQVYEEEEDLLEANMSGFGQLIFGLWSLVLAQPLGERCNKEWLAEFLICGQIRYTGDWLGELQRLFVLEHVSKPEAWELLCELGGGLFPLGNECWLQELSQLSSQQHVFFAPHSRVLLDLPSTDGRNFGLEFLRDGVVPPAPGSILDLFGETNKPDYVRGFILSNVAVLLGNGNGIGFAGKLQAQTHRLFLNCPANKPYGLFVAVRNTRQYACQCVLVRALATPRKEWAIDAVLSFASEFNADGGGMEEMLHLFAQELVRNDPDLIAQGDNEEGQEGFMTWSVREDGQRRTTFRPTKLIVSNMTAMAASTTVEIAIQVDEKTMFDWPAEKLRFDKVFQELISTNLSTEAITKYHDLLQRNYVHETMIAQHIHYFALLCELVVQHVEVCSGLLEDSDICESLDFLCEDMKDALDLAREDGLAEDEVLDFALAMFRKIQRALR